MIKKVNKNKFGIIEYSITSEEDLKDLPKGDTDNSVYAVDDNNNIYLYSKKANDYILINGGFLKRINMGDNPSNEVDFELFEGDGYYSVIGSIGGDQLLNSIVYFKKYERGAFLTLYEHCKHVYCMKDDSGVMKYAGYELFNPLNVMGKLVDLPEGLQPCNTLVEAIQRLYSLMTES